LKPAKVKHKTTVTLKNNNFCNNENNDHDIDTIEKSVEIGSLDNHNQRGKKQDSIISIDPLKPTPRFNAMLAIQKNVLYMYVNLSSPTKHM